MNYKNTFIKNALLLCLLAVTFAGQKATGQTVKASSFGYNSSDATSALAKALKSDNDKIIVDYKSGGWNVGPLKLFDVKDKEIVFESGVVLKAIKGRFKSRTAALLNLVRPRNLKITGYGATFKMDRSELQSYDSRTEYRHSLQIIGGTNVTVKGLKIDQSGGDGVYIDGSTSGLAYSKNIVLEDLKVTNHSRDAISVISVDGLTVKNCDFTGTKSNILGCGINLEPDTSKERLTNIRFENCRINNNFYYGIQVSLYNLSSSSTPVDIRFKSCTLTNNYKNNPRGGSAEMIMGVGRSFNNAVRGQLTFDNVKVEDVSHGVFLSRKPSTAFKANFVNCTFENVASSGSAITLETPSYDTSCPPLGGFNFDNVKISSSSSSAFLRFIGWKTMDGLKDITGDFIVANSKLNKDNAIRYSNVKKFSNVDIDYQLVSKLPSGSSGSSGGGSNNGGNGGNDNNNGDGSSGGGSDTSDDDPPTSGGGSSSGDCTSNVSITKKVTSATVKQAANTLTASSTVDHSSGTVRYQAGKRVVFKDGFRVSADGKEIFKAVLGQCSGSSSSGKVASLKAGFYYNWNPEVEEVEEVAAKPILTPNPIANIAVLNFTLPADDYVSVNVYDMNNQIVRSVLNNERMFAGPQQLDVDLSSLMPGLYLLGIEGTSDRQIIKAIKR